MAYKGSAIADALCICPKWPLLMSTGKVDRNKVFVIASCVRRVMNLGNGLEPRPDC